MCHDDDGTLSQVNTHVVVLGVGQVAQKALGRAHGVRVRLQNKKNIYLFYLFNDSFNTFFK